MSTPEQRKDAFDGVVDKILAPLAEPLSKILDPIIRRAKAEAWHEGYTHPGQDAADNPYLDRPKPACEKFRYNSIDALLTTPECEDYCARCGKHRQDHHG